MNLHNLQSLLKAHNIIASELLDNNKASEKYVRTTFVQKNGFKWDTVVPYVDRRAGLEIKTEKELAEYLKSLKKYFTEQAMQDWKKEELKRGWKCYTQIL